MVFGRHTGAGKWREDQRIEWGRDRDMWLWSWKGVGGVGGAGMWCSQTYFHGLVPVILLI